MSPSFISPVEATITSSARQFSSCAAVEVRVVGTGTAHAVVANAGCANACTGEQGIRDAEKMAEIAAHELNCRADDVIVASTGLIGSNLPMDKMEAGIKD